MYTIIFLSFVFVVFIIPFPIKIYFEYRNNDLTVKIFNKKIDLDKLLLSNKKKERHDRKVLIKSVKEIWLILKYNRLKPYLKLNVDIDLGLDDAANTAIMYGIVYSSIYPILRYILSSCFKLIHFHLNVNPKFNKKVLNGTCKSIISINLAKIIYISLNLFININKLKRHIREKIK